MQAWQIRVFSNYILLVVSMEYIHNCENLSFQHKLLTISVLNFNELIIHIPDLKWYEYNLTITNEQKWIKTWRLDFVK